jgi:hypothetical protein
VRYHCTCMAEKNTGLLENPLERRRRAAKKAVAASKEHEHDVASALASLEERRIVRHVLHNEPGWVRGKGGWIRARASAADFNGIFPGGKMWAIEAKTVGPDENGNPRSMTLSKVTEEQQRQLWTLTHEAGPEHALLAVRFRYGDGHIEDFLGPWKDLPWRGRVSFRADDMRQWQCHTDLETELESRWSQCWRKETA